VSRTGFILTVLAMAAAMAVANPASLIFADGFETGNSIAWQQDLPLGFYEVPTPAIPESAQLGTNVVANPYWAQGRPTTPPILAASNASEQKTIAGFDEPLAMSLNKQYIADYISLVRDHPALLGYYLPDEAMSRGLSLSKIRALYQEIKKNDPSLPVVLADFTGWNRAKGSYDIFAYDMYPIGSASIQQYRSNIRSVVEDVAPAKVWVVLQAFASGSQWIEPTRDEIRAMAYVALLNGGQGLLAYYWGYVASRPALRDTFEELFHELRDFSSPLLASPPAGFSASTGRTGLDLLLQPGPNRTLLFAVNWKSVSNYLSSHDPGVSLNGVEIDLEGLGNGYFEVIAGDGIGDRIDVVDGRMTDDFEPYATKVYEWHPQP
jgi:hypothetical protein